MFRHPDPEVLVVGAGPVGLVAALFLAAARGPCGDRRHAPADDSAQLRPRDPSAHAPDSRRGRTLRRADRRGAEADESRLLRRTGEARRNRLFGPRVQASVSPRRPPEPAGEGRGGGAPAEEPQGPLGTPTPGPRRRRRDPPGRSREARPGRDRLSRRAKRVGRRAERDDPTGLCHRRRRVRLGRAADVWHRDGRAWRGPDLLHLRDRGDGRASRRSARHLSIPT